MSVSTKITNLLLATLIFFSFSSFASNKAADKTPIKAIVFDAFTIIDPRDIVKMADDTYPGHGPQLMEFLFDYKMLGSIIHDDVKLATEVSLVSTLSQMQLNLPENKIKKFVNLLLNPKPWPQTAESIKQFKAVGIELVVLSNMPDKLFAHALKQTDLEKDFKFTFSVDDIATPNIDPTAYAQAANKLGLPKESILFVTSAGRHITGAKQNGYPTFWMNYQSTKADEQTTQADATGKDLASLVKFVSEYNKVRSNQ